MLDNSILINLLETFNKSRTREKYTHIIDVLNHGEVYLLLPAVHDNSGSGQWKTLSPGDQLKLNTVYNMDGIKVLAAFTSEEAIITWAKQIIQYYAMDSKDVLKICEDYGIDRLIIDNSLPTMFVMERQTGKVEVETIAADTPVNIIPAMSLDGNILTRLKRNFADIPELERAYQYVMIRNSEHSRIIAFQLLENSEQVQDAAIQATQKAFYGEKVDLPVEVFFIETESTHDQIKKVENSLIYSINNL